jgi:hypothetical protein
MPYVPAPVIEKLCAKGRYMPKSKYQEIIEEWCQTKSVTIPTGFYRHTAGHLAIIKPTDSGLQLVATTWTVKADVISYLLNYGSNAYMILDFKVRKELDWKGGKTLSVKGSF